MKSQLQVLRITLLWFWVPLLVLLAAAALARVAFRTPWHHLLVDPVIAMGAPFYLGFLSNVGVLMWTSAASVLLFAYWLHRRRGADRLWGRFLLCSGLFIAWLGLDDLFVLHDHVFSKHLSIGEPVTGALYASAAIVYVVAFARVIRQSAWLVLGAALGLLAASLASEWLPDTLPAKPLWEDALKLLGIGAWLSYSLHTAGTVLERSFALSPARYSTPSAAGRVAPLAAEAATDPRPAAPPRAPLSRRAGSAGARAPAPPA